MNLCEHLFLHSCIRLFTVPTTQWFIAFYSFHSLHLLLSLQTMSAAAEPAHSSRKPVGGFPSDPRYAASTLTATPSEMSCLGTTEYLSTAVLDCIIRCTALPPNSSEEAFPPMIGSLGCEGYISSCNCTAASLKRDQVRMTAEWKEANQRQVLLLCRRLAGIINPKPPIDLPQRLIIPIINPPDMLGQFFVACFEFDVWNPKFFVAIRFYDSLERAKGVYINQVLRRQ